MYLRSKNHAGHSTGSPVLIVAKKPDGSILDPLAASLVGNIHNPSDSNDVVLGYFETSAITSKKVIIPPFFLQLYYLEIIEGEYTPKGDCKLVFPNSLADDADPQGWDSAQTIDLH